MTQTATVRNDWLPNALARAGFFVSGSPISSRRCGVGEGRVTIRFIGHFPLAMHTAEGERFRGLPSHYELMQGLVTVEMPTQQEVSAFVASADLVTLVERLRRLFETPIAVVVYASTSQTGPQGGQAIGDPLWVRDLDHADGWSHEGIISPTDYAARINGRRAPVLGDDPQIKPVHISLNDAFQDWTRNYLSSQLSINDIDALRMQEPASEPPRVLIVELKRSLIGLETWMPYLDDIPNFMLTKAVARKHVQRRALDVTIQYQAPRPGQQVDRPWREDAVGLHGVTAVSYEGITGFRKIVQADQTAWTQEPAATRDRAKHAAVVAAITAELAQIMDEAYTSNNRRS